jgi:hypothetical protein
VVHTFNLSYSEIEIRELWFEASLSKKCMRPYLNHLSSPLGKRRSWQAGKKMQDPISKIPKSKKRAGHGLSDKMTAKQALGSDFKF